MNGAHAGPQRRSVLKAALVLPAAVAGTSASVNATPAMPVAESATAPRPQGYHLSDHIRRYYALAKY